MAYYFIPLDKAEVFGKRILCPIGNEDIMDLAKEHAESLDIHHFRLMRVSSSGTSLYGTFKLNY